MTKRKFIPNLVLKDAEIRFKNFSGLPGQYNREGDRNFCVLLNHPDVDVEAMVADGWNVKMLKPRDEDEAPTPYIQVAVSYKIKPPSVFMLTSRGKTELPEELVSMIDLADIARVDLTINPSFWDVNGNTGVKAYLKNIYVTIQENELDLMYQDVPDSAMGTIEAFAEPLQITDGQDDEDDGVYVEYEES